MLTGLKTDQFWPDNVSFKKNWFILLRTLFHIWIIFFFLEIAFYRNHSFDRKLFYWKEDTLFDKIYFFENNNFHRQKIILFYTRLFLFKKINMSCPDYVLDKHGRSEQNWATYSVFVETGGARTMLGPIVLLYT